MLLSWGNIYRIELSSGKCNQTLMLDLIIKWRRASQIYFPFTQIFSLKTKYTGKRNIFTWREILLQNKEIFSLSGKYFYRRRKYFQLAEFFLHGIPLLGKKMSFLNEKYFRCTKSSFFSPLILFHLKFALNCSLIWILSPVSSKMVWLSFCSSGTWCSAEVGEEEKVKRAISCVSNTFWEQPSLQCTFSWELVLCFSAFPCCWSFWLTALSVSKHYSLTSGKIVCCHQSWQWSFCLQSFIFYSPLLNSSSFRVPQRTLYVSLLCANSSGNFWGSIPFFCLMPPSISVCLQFWCSLDTFEGGSA